jgi:hypothetical protein
MDAEAPSGAHEAEKAGWLRAVSFAAVIDHVTVEVVDALTRSDVASLLLRGPVIATWLYDHPTERPYGDIDLMVDPDRLDAARGVLTRLGFTHQLERATPLDHTFHDEPWLRGAHFVDVHRTLSGAGTPPATVWQALTREMTEIVIDGTPVPAPGVAGRLVVVVLHAAHHGVDFAKPLEDLQRAVERVPVEAWRAAARVAAQIDASAAFASGLRLLPSGAALTETLELPRATSVEAVLRASSAPPMAIALEWLAHGPLTRRQKVAFVARKVVPPPAFLRASSRLANRGWAGLAAAYVLRIGSLAAKLPAGLRALGRARRQAPRAPDR